MVHTRGNQGIHQNVDLKNKIYLQVVKISRQKVANKNGENLTKTYSKYKYECKTAISRNCFPTTEECIKPNFDIKQL